MTILQCLSNSSFQKIWLYGFYSVGGLFGLLFLIVILFFISRINAIHQQKWMVICSEIFLLLTLFSKFFTFTYPAIEHEKFNQSKNASAAIGLGLFETPCYIVTTCYSLTLISWLNSCISFLPPKAQHFATNARKIMLAINITLYITFICNLIYASYIKSTSDIFQDIFATVTIVLRDFVMGFTFIIFLKCGFGVSKYQKSSSREKRLFLMCIIFAVILLLRAIVVIIQTIIQYCFNDSDSEQLECKSGFYITFILNELILEFLPCTFLAYLDINYIITQSSIKIVQLNDEMASAESIDKQPLIQNCE